MLVLPVVSLIVEDVELASVVVARGLLLGVVRYWCFCLFVGLVVVIRASSELAVIRRARNMLCGVACGWEDVLFLLDYMRRFLFAFLERLCGFDLHDLLGVCFWSMGLSSGVCVVLRVCVGAERVFICVKFLLHCVVGIILSLLKVCLVLHGEV
jgi:hypothetical protein